MHMAPGMGAPQAVLVPTGSLTLDVAGLQNMPLGMLAAAGLGAGPSPMGPGPGMGPMGSAMSAVIPAMSGGGGPAVGPPQGPSMMPGGMGMPGPGAGPMVPPGGVGGVMAGGGSARTSGPPASDEEHVWYYIDPQGNTQGPCSMQQLRQWIVFLSNSERYVAEYEQFKSVQVWRSGMDQRLPILVVLGMG